jgi:hypothetical protein
MRTRSPLFCFIVKHCALQSEREREKDEQKKKLVHRRRCMCGRIAEQLNDIIYLQALNNNFIHPLCSSVSLERRAFGAGVRAPRVQCENRSRTLDALSGRRKKIAQVDTRWIFADKDLS